MENKTYADMKGTPLTPPTDEGPRLQYKNMPGSKNTERTHPGKISAKTFSQDEIVEAFRLAQTLGTEETKNWLKSSNFRKDPTFIEKVLTWGRNELPRQLKEFGVKSLEENPEVAVRIRNELQGGFEGAIMSARNEWIKEHGPIENYSHPADEWESVKEEILKE